MATAPGRRNRACIESSRRATPRRPAPPQNSSLVTQSGVNDLIEEDPSFQPEIKPILDLEELKKQAGGIGGLIPAVGVTASIANSARPAAPIAVDTSDTKSQNGVTNITFNQTNNSPEALDAATIYRNTNTQLAMAKDKLTL